MSISPIKCSVTDRSTCWPSQVGRSRSTASTRNRRWPGSSVAADRAFRAWWDRAGNLGSTDTAAKLGDRRWRDLLDRHDQSVRTELQRFRGREVTTVGDGFVATFESPGRAIECALAIRQTLAAFDIGVRAGIHTGEIEIRGDDVVGLAVHIGARVSALAGPGEVLVSSTVKDLVVGSTFEFNERGEHELKGVPGAWRLYDVHT